MAKIAKIQLDDGRIARFEVPDDFTPEQVQQAADEHFSSMQTRPVESIQPKQNIKQDQFGTQALDIVSGIPVESLKKAFSNAPKSAANLASGLVGALSHPVDTAGTMLDIGAGGISKLLPDSVNNALDPEGNKRAQTTFDQALAYYKNRLGGIDEIKNTFETDPVGLMSDASLVAAPFSPKLATAINPVSIAGKGIAKAAPVLGNLSAELIGGLGTHTGAESIKQAASSGFTGGQKSADFLDNYLGKVPNSSVVKDLKRALKEWKKKDYAEYENSMSALRQDTTPLDYGKIKLAANTAKNIDVHRGVDINPGSASVKQQITQLLNQFELNGLNTVDDFDALKRGIGNIRSGTQPGTAERRAADGVYQAVKKEIVKQSPAYEGIMKKSEAGIDARKEATKAFSLGENTMEDSAMRKLQSLTRNNVQTNYGNRLTLGQMLEQNGADNLIAKLSGQALNTWQPRSAGSIIAGGAGVGGLLTGNPLAGVIMAGQLPKLMGGLSYGAGATARPVAKGLSSLTNIADSLNIEPSILANLVIQSEQSKPKRKK